MTKYQLKQIYWIYGVILARWESVVRLNTQFWSRSSCASWFWQPQRVASVVELARNQHGHDLMGNHCLDDTYLPSGCFFAFFIAAMMQKSLQKHSNVTVMVAALHLRAIWRHISWDVDVVIIITIILMINGVVWVFVVCGFSCRVIWCECVFFAFILTVLLNLIGSMQTRY